MFTTLPCRHCGKGKVNRPRGLCWPCYYKPGVKDLYPSTSKYAKRGVGNLTSCRTPRRPTNTEPGSEERMEVFAERIARGENLFHPQDARIETTTEVVVDTPLRVLHESANNYRESAFAGLWGSFGKLRDGEGGEGEGGSGFERRK